MKKLFAALASAALVGTVFAQTGVPASATQPQGEATKDHVTASKGKADVHATPHKSASKATHHKAGKASKATAAKPEAAMSKSDAKAGADKAKADAMMPAAQPSTAKDASTDKTKKQ